MPEARVGNILTRPNLRGLEFAYLAKHSDLRKIELSDILISVRNGKIVLRSSKLNCFLLPRLTNAHNFSTSKLPVYRFLCELQNQDRHIPVFRWPALLNSQSFLPRIKFNSVIIEPARWSFSQEDMPFLRNNDLMDKVAQLKEWIYKWKLPRYFTLVEGDNELLIDRENDFLLNIFFSEVKKKNRILLKESFEPLGDAIVQGSESNGFSNQFLFFYKNEIEEFLA